MQMDAGLDTGPVHLARVDADRRARNGRRAPRPARRSRGGGTAGRGLPSICSRATLVAVPQQQTRSRPSRPKIAKAEALLDWREPAAQLERRVRAFNPWPVAEAQLSDGRRLRVFEADGRGAAPACRAARHDRRRRPRRHRRRRGGGRAAAAPNPTAFGSRDGRRGLSRGASAGGSWRLSPEPVAGAAPRCGPWRRSSSRACSTSASPADDAACRAAGVAARDQPLLAALVFGALRWHYRLEWQATRLLTRPLERATRARSAALLRIGLLQLQELRVPEHAAVSATVDATALLGLRSAARARERGAAAVSARARAARRRPRCRADEARFAHPRWLIDAISRATSPHDWQAVLDANNAPRPDVAARQSAAHDPRATISTSSRRPGWPRVAAPDVAVRRAPRRAAPASTRCRGSRRARCRCRTCRRSMRRDLLELDAGQRVLDACAAPGGKTGHILEAMPGRGEVWAVDRDAARLDRVRDNLERLGLAATLVAGDATAPERVVGRPAVRPDSHRRAVQRDRRHSPPSRHQGAAPARRTSSARSRSRPRLLRGAVAAAAPRAAGSSTRLARSCKRENDEQIAAFRRRRADDRAAEAPWRRCNYCPKRRAAMASIMLGYESRTCCERPVDLPPQP